MVAVTATVVALAGTSAFALQTAGTAHSGAIPSAGPAGTGGFGGGPGGGRGGFTGGTGGGPGGTGGFGAGNGSTTGGPGGGVAPSGAGGFGGGQGGAGQGGGGMGGLLAATTPSADLVKALQTNTSRYRWAAAVTGSNNAAGYQLATGLPVMAIGGFNGTDAAPTLAQFQSHVRAGEIHYYISGALLGGRGQSPGGGSQTTSSGSDAATQIADWVAQNHTATTVGGATVYDLSGAQ